MIIKKKTWPEYFDPLKSGKKNFDLRLADFKCRVGDTIVFQEWNPKTKKYTGREIKKKIGYIMKTKKLNFWSEKEIKKYGYQIISFK